MNFSTFALKRPLARRTSADLLARLWQGFTRAEPPAGAPLGELDSHLLRDIQAPGRIHGQTQEHSELARYDRQQAQRAAKLKI